MFGIILSNAVDLYKIRMVLKFNDGHFWPVHECENWLAFFISSQVSSANAAVVVLVSDNVLTQLYPIYFNARNVATSQELNDVAASLYDLLLTGTVSGQVRNHSDTVQATISTLISKTATIEFSTTDYVNTMLNIFHRIASDITFE